MSEVSVLEVEYERGGDVRPTEIMDLRTMAGSTAETIDVWEDQLSRSLCVITARDVARGSLVGIVFVLGSKRHMNIVDLTVHRDYQRQGIGNRIGDELEVFIAEQQPTYLGLTYDKEKPWLKEWYEQRGFRSIDFAMWHTSSLKNTDAHRPE